MFFKSVSQWRIVYGRLQHVHMLLSWRLHWRSLPEYRSYKYWFIFVIFTVLFLFPSLAQFDVCQQKPCLNGATCTVVGNGFECTCKPGFMGTLCEGKRYNVHVCSNAGIKIWITLNKILANINECASNPCENGGICVDLANMFSCSCHAGFTGAACESNLDDLPYIIHILVSFCP